jgi:hypothetical protein
LGFLVVFLIFFIYISTCKIFFVCCKTKTKINIKRITTRVQHPSYHVIVRGSKAQFSSMVISISQRYQHNFLWMNIVCRHVSFLQKRTDVKSLNIKYGLCPLFLFDNSDVTLLFTVKRQHFRRVFYFLGTDVIFLRVYEHCLSTRLFFFTEKDRCQKFKYKIWIMSIVSFW